MTKLKPILFSTPMVQAILEGRKTQTRRVLKQEPTDFIIDEFRDVNPVPCVRKGDNLFEAVPQSIFKDDILWVRETWTALNTDEGIEYAYRAGVHSATLECMEDYKLKWKPSIFMPKQACRIFLKVTNVRVERLNDISDDDAEKEGIKVSDEGFECWDYLENKWGNFGFTPQESFRSLWESINGSGSWEKKPYVWVYEFERVEKPEAWP